MMNAAITFALGACLVAVAIADIRVMIGSTYTGPKGLNDLATSMGEKYMGTTTDIKQLSDKFYATELNNTHNFGMISPANSMMWDATEAIQGVFTFEDADAIVAFASKSGAQVRCQTLVSHKQVPNWVQRLEKAELLKAMSNHITNVMTHFGDVCSAWDVVSDVIEDDGSYRQSFWFKKTGKDYISTAFETANAVKVKLKLKTRLYYNDFGISIVNKKDSDSVAGAHIFNNFRRFTIKNMDVAITKLDVTTSTANPTVIEQQKQVGIYTNVISACKKTKRCVGVTMSDFVDTYSSTKLSAPLLFYQPGGANTHLVRKASYDAITSGWIL
ncbi:unnamed protein product [Peronospora effusa]|nr:unnamed protein product [Peronospora effusa]